MATKDTITSTTTSSNIYDPSPTLNTTNMSSSPTRLYPTVGGGGVATNGAADETAFLGEQQNEEIRHELAKTEEEIDTLRRVLQSKIKHANDLKRRLGISAWDELTKDVQTGLSTLTDSETYQKAANSIGHVKDRSVELISGVTTGLTKKMGDLKNTNAFKSFEASAGGIVNQVKAKVGSGTTPSAEYPPSEFPIGANSIGISPYEQTTTTTSTTATSAHSPSKQQTYGATYSATTPTAGKAATTSTTTTKITEKGISNA